MKAVNGKDKSPAASPQFKWSWANDGHVVVPKEALHESILVVPRRCAKLKALTLSNLGVSKASSDAARGYRPLILVHHALCTEGVQNFV